MCDALTCVNNVYTWYFQVDISILTTVSVYTKIIGQRQLGDE